MPDFPLLPRVQPTTPRCEGKCCLALATVTGQDGKRYCAACKPPYEWIITDEIWDAGKLPVADSTRQARHPDSSWVSGFNAKQGEAP